MSTISLADALTALFMLIGTFFMCVGAFGLLRMPDLFMRMSSTTKSVTLGVSFMLLAAAVHFHEHGLGMRILATIAFVFITAPVAAHMIGRAGYARDVQLWEGTVTDELKGKYVKETGELLSQPPPARFGSD